jgi:hypothetical protein
MEVMPAVYGPGAMTAYLLLLLGLVAYWTLPYCSTARTSAWLFTPIVIYYAISILYLICSIAKPFARSEEDGEEAAAALFVVEMFLLVAPVLSELCLKRVKGWDTTGASRATMLLGVVIPGIALEIKSFEVVVRFGGAGFSAVRPVWMVVLWCASPPLYTKRKSG